MSMLLDPPRTAGDAVASDAVASSAAAFMAECALIDLNDQSIPGLDAYRAVADQIASFAQGWRTQISAQRTKVVDAGRPEKKSGSDPVNPEKPEKQLPKPGKSRAEHVRDEAAARAVRWAPSFGLALRAGAISMDHVVALGRVRNHGCVPAHETGLLSVAQMRTAEDFAKHLARWDAERDREAGVDRAVTQRRKRAVSFFDRDDMRGMFALLPVADAERVENTLRQIADELFRASGDEGTTPTQRLADALVLMADRSSGAAESSKSSRPTIVVICHEESLRSRVEDAGLGHTLDGKPVPASELRRLACDANILPVVMSGTGQILDWGRTHRTATDAQRLALLTMYGGCIIDGCKSSPHVLDMHHLQFYEHGGPTDLANLAPLCKGDHTRSHAERWTYTRHADGRLTVTTADGQVVPTRPRRTPG